jgi:putative membrane protein
MTYDTLTNMALAIAWALLGVLLFIAAFALVDRLTPGSLWKELIEERNVALAVLMGFFALGLSVIIAAAVN